MLPNWDADKSWAVAKGAAVAAAGAALAYLGQWLSGQDLGAFGPLAAAGMAVAVNVLRKWAEPAPPAGS